MFLQLRWMQVMKLANILVALKALVEKQNKTALHRTCVDPYKLLNFFRQTKNL